jgi:hypothetical protein
MVQKIRKAKKSPPRLPSSGGRKVESDLTAANGTWIIQQIDLNLAAETLNGPWQMTVTGARAS